MENENFSIVDFNESHIQTFCKIHHFTIEEGEFRMSMSKYFTQQTQYKFKCKKGRFNFRHLSPVYEMDRQNDLFKELMRLLEGFVKDIESVSKDVEGEMTVEELRRRIAIYEKYCHFKCMTWPTIENGQMTLYYRCGLEGAALCQTCKCAESSAPSESEICKNIWDTIKKSFKIVQ